MFRISESSSMKYFSHVPKYLYVYSLSNQRKYLMSRAILEKLYNFISRPFMI